MAARFTATQPTTLHELGTLRKTGRPLDTQTQDFASISQRAFLRQTPEVGAVCGKSARTDLRGGLLARAVPTATLSARSMPEDGQEHVLHHMLLPSRSSFGHKAINLLNWCEAPTKAKQATDRPPVGHMSVFNVLRAGETSYLLEGRGPIGRTGSPSENPLTRLVNTTPRHTLSIGLYRLGGGGSLSCGLSRPALA